MRDYYAEHQIAPDVRHVMKHLEKRLGRDSRNAIFELFPYGYVKQACKIAGMKQPRGRSTGQEIFRAAIRADTRRIG